MSIWGLNNFNMPIQPSYMPVFNPSIHHGGLFPSMPPIPPYAIDLFMPFNNFYNPFISNPLTMNIFGSMQSMPAPNPNNTLSVVNSSPTTNIFGFLNTQSANNNVKIKTTLKLPELKEAGYNKKKGEELAKIISARSTYEGFDNFCARNVKKAIQDAGLGRYEYGHGYQMADILSRNKNFKEISTKNINLSKLPAGCILVYDKGIAGYSSEYGHTEITLGDGRAASGGITRNIRNGARVFIPV